MLSSRAVFAIPTLAVSFRASSLTSAAQIRPVFFGDAITHLCELFHSLNEMSKTIGSDQSGLNRLIRVSRDEGMEVEKIANFLSISDPKFQRKTSYPATKHNDQTSMSGMSGACERKCCVRTNTCSFTWTI